MRVFICEDIPEHSQRLQTLIEEIGIAAQWNVEVHTFESGEGLLSELYKRIERKEAYPDVVFADIRLPGMDGIALGKRLKEAAQDVVLVLLTAYEEYAIRGYETGAYRYLLKPPTQEDVTNVFSKIAEQKSEKKTLVVQSGDREVLIPVRNIRYIGAEDKYVMLYTTEGDFLDRRSLQYFEACLEDMSFYRIHRKYLVNMRFHKALDDAYVMLTTGEKLPVSRRNIASYRKCFLKHLEGGRL